MTDEFGVTGWGRDWVRLAQPTTITRPNPGLPRARSLARQGHVTTIEFAPGSITATVTGATDRHVELSFPRWSIKQVADADRILGTATNGDLSDALHSELNADRLPPSPRADELGSTCDCPKKSRPCVHILTVLFEVARRIDEQPRLALTIRGFKPRSRSHSATIPITDLDPIGFFG